MDKIAINEVVTLDNGKEFYCFQVLTQDDIDYIYLISTSKPVEICFAEQKIVDGALSLRIINDQDEKLRALKLFQDDYKSKDNKTTES